jgi:hypothetical protein
MKRAVVLPLLLCIACDPGPRAMTEDTLPPPSPAVSAAPPAERPPALDGLIDVSGDDCTSSAFVYDATPSSGRDLDSATAFINDGCVGDRIFLGINAERRELRRAENVPLGTGGEYSDSIYRVRVRRGRLVSRSVVYEHPDAQCPDSTHKELELVYDAEVVIAARGLGSRTIQGTLREPGCGP